MLEAFLERVRSKAHILELLPAYSISCCLISESDQSTFVISREKMELIDSFECLDIRVEGPSDILSELIDGEVDLTNDKLIFRGSFRHYLLLDSILILSKEASS